MAQSDVGAPSVRVDWVAERDRLAAADASGGLSPEELERWAVAAFLLGDDEQVERLRERAFEAYLAGGDRDAAVRCAYWLGFHLSNRGEGARAAGWLARVRRLVGEAAPPGPLTALLLMPGLVQLMFSHRGEEALPGLERCIALAVQHGDPDTFVLAGLARGRCLLELGRTDEAVAALDEAMVHVVAGRVAPQVIGLAYCSVIDLCLSRHDVQRAGEWTRALTGWCDEQAGLVPYRGVCLVHRAALLELHGSWDQATEQARDACVRLQRSREPAIGGAHYRVGELLRLRGDLAGAERAYGCAGQHGHEVQPGLALLRLAQGQPATALAGLRRALAEPQAPGLRPLLLAAATDVCLALDDVAGARRAADELAGLAAAEPLPYLQALACRCDGAVLLYADQPEPALVRLRRAWSGWQEIDAPYEAARTRVLVAAACRRLGDEDAAQMEADAARTVFVALGAVPDMAAVDRTAPAGSATGGGPLSPRELEVLRLVATGSTSRVIAAELFLSEKTVARHLSNIFAKLGVPSRAAATAYAFRHGLV